MAKLKNGTEKDNVDGLLAEGVTEDSFNGSTLHYKDLTNMLMKNSTRNRTADEKAVFIDGLNKASIDADGNPVKLTAADLAETSGLSLSNHTNHQNELQKNSKELEAATGKGQEELTMGAINAIGVLVKREILKQLRRRQEYSKPI